MNLMVSPANKVFQDKLEYQGNKVLQEKEVLLDHQEEMVLTTSPDNQDSKVKVYLRNNKEQAPGSAGAPIERGQIEVPGTPGRDGNDGQPSQ